ncbi:MAG: hypothetical protein IPI23_16430 [Bacteroidetes bacterium]|nr:hypothetical protein [Bacteroidota bacterium]
MENLLAGNKNPFMLARLYYTKAIVLNFSIPKEEIFDTLIPAFTLPKK